MDGILLEVDRPESDVGGWADLIRELTQEVNELREEVATLRGENLELRQQVGYWKSMHARALERIAVLEKENEHLRGENRRLQDRLFGQKSEKQSGKDRSNHLDGLEEDKPKTDPTTDPKKRKKGPKRRDNTALPAKEEIIELPPDERACPTCGKPRQEMTATEDSEQIEIEVKAHRLEKSCCNHPDGDNRLTVRHAQPHAAHPGQDAWPFQNDHLRRPAGIAAGPA
jgi:regulator of replication initiation timing